MGRIGWFAVAGILHGLCTVTTLQASGHTLEECIEELDVLAQQWLADDGPGEKPPSANRTGDSIVNMVDYAELATRWASGELLTGKLKMTIIPGGPFEMGDYLGDGWPDELPVCTVGLNSFAMGVYEVTNQLYCDFLNEAFAQGMVRVSDGVVYQANSECRYPYCNTARPGRQSSIDYEGGVFTVRRKNGRTMVNDPVVEVSWFGAVAYCHWCSLQDDYSPCYDLHTWECDFEKNGYRLPTEAEWEYAARSVSPRRFPWGATITHDQANYRSYGSYTYDISLTRGFHPLWNDGIEPYTSPVGSFAANRFGLCDMAGNVWEWCHDRYSNALYDDELTMNPTGPDSGLNRVVRGGGWDSGPSACRTTFRYGFSGVEPSFRCGNGGFRVVRRAELVEELVLISGGIFNMGNFLFDSLTQTWRPSPVALNSFRIGGYEITNQQYCEYLNSAAEQGEIEVDNRGRVFATGSEGLYPYCGTFLESVKEEYRNCIAYDDGVFYVRTKAGRSMLNDPVVAVSWYGAIGYCNWRSQREGRRPCYDLSTWTCDFSKQGYRLPTSAEWEYAARGGLSGKNFPWGNTIWRAMANYRGYWEYPYGVEVPEYDLEPYGGYNPRWDDGVFPYTSPVGSYYPNGYGLYDMAGNASEWCYDRYARVQTYNPLRVNPTGPLNGSDRVARSSSWIGNCSGCLIIAISHRPPDYISFQRGFRIVLDCN